MINKVIGIISYLPDNLEIRKNRMHKLANLLNSCTYLFNLPVIIIAQNWKGITIDNRTGNNVQVFNYEEPLGINKARNELRNKFLESEYDYLIMLDDDIQLQGTKEDGQDYLRSIDENPDKWAYYIPHSLWLLAISRKMYNLFNWPEGGADVDDKNLRYFEDIYFEESMSKIYSNERFKWYGHKLQAIADAAYDKNNSGWHDKVYDSEGKWIRKNTGDSTRFLITQATADKILKPNKYIRRLEAEADPKKFKYILNKYHKLYPEG